MLDDRAVKLTGTLLGVAFDVTLEPVGTQLRVHGETVDGGGWKAPLDITAAFSADEETFTASGTLLGHEFSIKAGDAD